jgi:hypothetical protein
MTRLVGIGDLVNAVGVVERNAVGGLEVVVANPNAVRWLPWDVGRAPRSTLGMPSSPDAAPSIQPQTGTGEPQAGVPMTTIAAVAALFAVASALFVAAFAASPGNRARLRNGLAEASNRLRTRLQQLRSS